MAREVRRRRTSSISPLVPRKLEPLSENMCEGVPRLAQNLCRVATKAYDVKSEQSSRCTALVIKHKNNCINLQSYRVPWVPTVNQEGSGRVNTSSVVCKEGSSPIFWLEGLA